ncbi:spore germination protein [Sporolactobacillus shoreicorticis]|uniref:GerAB/ArcD/ProY family transporter n=1 Tax=Sporolactobacillus shoreicorticis TaxID=1923877 RepID=A0ABW5RZD4_9BACL|nr:GerAB/ArcD/ProY family transporter [Sporolactobacillus shoreicorticis]MCO7124906.1 spore germination protein [Sporolactobacillus shoreicorticis]
MTSPKINETQQVSPKNTMFIIGMMQIGVGLLSFQRIAALNSAQDAWFPVLLTGASTLIIMGVIFRLLENEKPYGTQELFSMHKRFFGTIVGNALNVVAIAYQFMVGLVFLRAYIEIINVWIFPKLSPLAFSFIFSVIIWYLVMGGFRAITGIFYLSFIYILPLNLVDFYLIGDSHLSNLLPMLEHMPYDYLQSFFKMIPCYLGFETILFYYPFLKRPKEAKQWAMFGLTLTTSVYVTLCILGTVYFSHGELMTQVWPIISFWKSIHFPLFDRFEYLGMILWIWALIPSFALGTWVVSRGIREITGYIKQKYALIFVFLLNILFCTIIHNRLQINLILHYLSYVGFGFLYIYIPFLFFWQWILKKKRRRKHV